MPASGSFGSRVPLPLLRLVSNAQVYLWARLATWEETAVIMGQRAAPVIMQCPEGLPVGDPEAYGERMGAKPRCSW